MRAALAVGLACALVGGCAQAATQHFTGTALRPVPAPDFMLTSDSGAPWTLSAQHGRVVALFFGFTHCDDTCRDTLAKLSAVIRKLGPKGGQAEIAFVTIDPERDTPAVMHAYEQRFSGAKMIGLTGTRAQIDRVMQEYYVWAKKVPGKGDDYDEQHSAFTYLIDRNGDERVIHNDTDSMSDYTFDIGLLLR